MNSDETVGEVIVKVIEARILEVEIAIEAIAEARTKVDNLTGICNMKMRAGNQMRNAMSDLKTMQYQLRNTLPPFEPSK